MPDASETGELAADLRMLVGQLVRRFRADGPLAAPQLSALAWLVREGPATASQLAAMERVRPQSMAHTLSELLTQELVERHPDPDDRRQVLIVATDAGRKLISDYRVAGESWVSAAIEERLAPGERGELARGVELLARLVAEQ